MNPVADIAVDRAMRLIARCLAAGRLRTSAAGLANLPARGPGLIVARHYHHLFDGLALFAAVRRRFHIVVTLDWARDRRTKYLMQTLNRLARWPMVLRNDALAHNPNGTALFSTGDVRRYQKAALRQAVELLRAGRLVVIFPEGYPNIDPGYTAKQQADQFLPFKAGFLTIVKFAERGLKSAIPIIPAGLSYRRGDPWLGRIEFGQALYRGDFDNEETLVEFIEGEVKRLSGVAKPG